MSVIEFPVRTPDPVADSAPLLSIRDLHVRFSAGRKTIDALNGVDLHVARGETVALIGESGSGKSVTLRTRCWTARCWCCRPCPISHPC